MNKHELITHCIGLLDEAIADIKLQMRELVINAENDSKSSAGDKHETGRAMMQLAQEQLGKQLLETEFKRTALARLDVHASATQIGEGCLVVTNENTLLIGTALGKITFERAPVFVISLQSPLAQLLLGKKSGDMVVFNQKQIKILSVS